VEETFTPNHLPYRKDVVEGVPVERHPCIRPRGFLKFAKAFDKGLGLYLYGPNSVGQIRSLLESDYDLLHCIPFVGTHNLYGFLASQIRKKRIVFTPCIHTADKYHFDRRYLFQMLKRATRVNAMTNYERSFLTGHGVPKERVFVTGMGVDPEEFNNVDDLQLGVEDDFIISYVGRLDRSKGIYDLLKCAAELGGITILVVGEVVTGFVDFYEALPARIKRRIKVWPYTPQGMLPRKHVLSVIKSSDVFCLPSTVESFGTVYLEAMMFSKPVIARNTPVASEVIGKAGLMVDDEVSLRKAILTLKSDRAMREELGSIGKRRAQSKYNWDTISEKFRESISCL
jgi:glycosyltransferase involved in cell wall biosynthesis